MLKYVLLILLSASAFAAEIPPWPKAPTVTAPGPLELQVQAPKNLMQPQQVHDQLAQVQAWAIPVLKTYHHKGAEAMASWLAEKGIISFIQRIDAGQDSSDVSSNAMTYRVMIGPNLKKDRLLTMVEDWPQHFPKLADPIAI